MKEKKLAALFGPIAGESMKGCPEPHPHVDPDSAELAPMPAHLRLVLGDYSADEISTK